MKNKSKTILSNVWLMFQLIFAGIIHAGCRFLLFLWPRNKLSFVFPWTISMRTNDRHKWKTKGKQFFQMSDLFQLIFADIMHAGCRFLLFLWPRNKLSFFFILVLSFMFFRIKTVIIYVCSERKLSKNSEEDRLW